ncbi:MAG: GerMN domain-containing protein [Candidatus Paceibacterota bacterium]
MSERNKIIFVGVGLAAATIAAILLFAPIGKKISEDPAKNGGEVIQPPSEGPMVRKGEVDFISVEGTDVSISSEEGIYSFSVSEADITDADGNPFNIKDIVVGAEIEAVVERGVASSVKVLSIPDIAIISPEPSSVTDLSFFIKGIAYNITEGDICLSLKNRRTGKLYKDNFSSPIDTAGNFSIPVDLSIALDAMSGDMLDAEIGICGDGEVAKVSWGYYGGLTSKIKVYFLNGSCSNLYYVERVISASRSAVREAIEWILKGPSDEEKEDGLFTAASPGNNIRSVDVQPGVVFIDFYPSILQTSRCGVSSLKRQIIDTTSQFPLGDIVITIEGDEENPLN